MVCPKCGTKNEQDAGFCQNCGTNLTEATQDRPAAMQPAFAAGTSTYVHPRKKNNVGLWITLGILLVVVALVLYYFGAFFGVTLFTHKDLGVTYTQADYDSVMSKIGLEIVDKAKITSDTPATITTHPIKQKEITKKSIKDYNWKFSDYKHKTFHVIPAEATAFFNEIAPSFWWFTDTQVKLESDGNIITSSTADIEKMKTDLFGDVAGQIPIPLPSKLDVYTEGRFSITNNKIDMQPTVFKAGNINVMNYIGGQNMDTSAGYLERFFTVIPDMKIYSAKADGEGGFLFDGYIPTKVEITPKN